MRALYVTCLTLAFFAATSSSLEAEPKVESFPILSGVGIALKADDGQLFVGGVLPNSPADQSEKIHLDDRLVAVELEGKRTALDGKTIGEAASLIRGPVGTNITLRIAPADGSKSVSVTLVRQPLSISRSEATSYQSFIGKPVPEFALRDLQGEHVQSLSERKGKIVIVDFWATWCGTCYAPIDRMQEIVGRHPEWKDDVEWITVAVNKESEQTAKVVADQGWVKTMNLSADAEQLDQLGISVVPIVMILDRNGTVLTMAEAHAVEIESVVGRLVKLKSSDPPCEAPQPAAGGT